MTYNITFRKHVLKIRAQERLSLAEASKRFGIGKQTLYNWSKRLEPKKTRNKPAVKIDRIALAEDVKNYPDAYHYERAARLNASPSGIGYALKRLGVSYKKNSSSSTGMPRQTAYLPRENIQA